MSEYHRKLARWGLVFVEFVLIGSTSLFASSLPVKSAQVDIPIPTGTLFLASNVQYSPAVDKFNTDEHIIANQSPLSNVTIVTSAGRSSAATTINAEAVQFGINPRIIIAFINALSLESSPNLEPDSIARNPLNLQGELYPSIWGFESQVQWLAGFLSNELIFRENSRDYTQVQFADGTYATVGYQIPTGNFVILSALAQIGDSEHWQQRYTNFLNEYTSSFGDPSSLSFDDSQIVVPPMVFPFTGIGRYTGGPHQGALGNCAIVSVQEASALDFAAQTPGQTFQVLNVADGILKNVVNLESAAAIDFGWTVSVEIANSGGLAVLYAHLDLSNSDVARLQALKDRFIPQGYVIGSAGRSGGQESIHVHLDLRYSGTTYDSYSTLGTHFAWEDTLIDGWAAHIHRLSQNGLTGYNYQGSLVKKNSKELQINADCGSSKKWATVGIGFSGTGENNGVEPNTVFADIGNSSIVSSSNTPITEYSSFDVAIGDTNGLVTAINNANLDTVPSVITLAPGTYSLTTVNNTTYGPTGLPVITTPITIVGNETNISRDSSAPSFRLFAVDTSGSLSLNGLTLSNGDAPYILPNDFIPRRGGGIYNLGQLTIVNSSFINNKSGRTGDYAGGSGGGLFSEGIVEIVNSEFTNNHSNLGGAISSNDILTIHNSRFSANTAEDNGGAIEMCGGTGSSLLTINDSDFMSNTASNGGAIYVTCPAVISGSIFENNDAISGGGINYGVNNLTLQNSNTRNTIFRNNTGSALFTQGNSGITLIQGSQGKYVLFKDNTDLGNTGRGGAIYHTSLGGSLSLVINYAEFSGNVAGQMGGGIYNSGGNLAISYSIFHDNRAEGSNLTTYGGNIHNANGDQAEIHNSCVVGQSSWGIHSYTPLDASNNWWGATDGPSGAGSGSGGAISTNVSYEPILLSAAHGCPSNDNLGDASSLTTTNTTQSSLSLATKSVNEPTPSCGINVEKTLWYVFQATTTGTLQLALSNAMLLDNILSVWSGNPNNLTEIGCRGGQETFELQSITSQSLSQITIETVPGTTYYIMVGEDQDTDGDFTLTSHFILPPSANAAPSRNYFTTSTPTLTWNRVSWAVEYQIEVSTNNNFTNIVYSDVIPGSTLSATTTELINGTYYWHVRACSSATTCGAWSVFDSFVVDLR